MMFWWFKVLSRWISLKNFSNSSGFLVKFRSFTWFHATSIPSYSSKKKRQREKMNAITLSSKLPCQVLPRTVQNQTKKKSNQIDYNEAWTFKFRRIILFHIFQKDQLQQTQSHLVQDGWCCSSFPKQRIKKSNTQIENIKKILEKRKRNTYSNVFYLVGFFFFFSCSLFIGIISVPLP